MTHRSYNQYCGLAYALDMVGERWTLLIVRELIAGPRRFKDLMDGLPGVSANLLAERLKGLEQQGMIRRRTLPPPAGSAVYELTAIGKAEVLQAQIKAGAIRVQQGQPWKADLVLRSDIQSFLAVFSGQIQPAEAIASGQILIEGDPGALSRWVKICGVPSAGEGGASVSSSNDAGR
jgi:DNA-binding HxlR family transcriptional regulator